MEGLYILCETELLYSRVWGMCICVCLCGCSTVWSVCVCALGYQHISYAHVWV